MKIDFDEEKHEYSVNGVKVPSVSEILAPLSADRYANIDPWILKAAAEKGRAVHEVTQIIDYGGVPDCDPEFEPYALAYQTFLCEHNVEWNMIEQIVPCYRTPEEIPIYCGTVDRVGRVDGRQYVIDIKTYASMSTDSLIAASCQTQLYRAALEESIKDIYDLSALAEPKRAVVHLRKDGSYRMIDLEEFDIKRGFNSKAVAWRLYELNRDLNEARKNKKRKGK